MHLNLVIFSGIIDGPIDIRQSRSGTEVMSFPLLVIRPSRAGYGREERLRLRTVSFGRAHESIRSLLAQGDTILIQGELTYYEGGGQSEYSVIARAIQPLGRNRESEDLRAQGVPEVPEDALW